jgi:hypothetical protein
MRSILVVAIATLAVLYEPGVTCRIGTGWQGDLAQLAVIQASHERQQAEQAGRAFPQGAPEKAAWDGLLRCSKDA